MKYKEYFVGLDIGTTKIVTMVGTKNEYGKIKILGYGQAYHHHQEAQQNHPFLPPPHRPAVEQCAHVDGVVRRHVCVPPCPFSTQSAPAGAAWRHPSWAARTRTGRPESARTACRCPPDTGSPAPSPPPETA